MIRSLPTALVGTAAIVAVAVGVQSNGRQTDLPREPIVERSGTRIHYPPGHPSAIQLPDGERRGVQSLLDIRRPMHFGDHVWDEREVPTGAVWIRVDLARQIISVFRAGHEIGSAVILYGTDGKPTPTGVFHVLERAREHRSNLYDAEMPYMLRLTNDGVAIHASKVREGSATHGCIGVPLEFARRLFAVMRRGDLVVIAAGDKQAAISAVVGTPSRHREPHPA